MKRLNNIRLALGMFLMTVGLGLILYDLIGPGSGWALLAGVVSFILGSMLLVPESFAEGALQGFLELFNLS